MDFKCLKCSHDKYIVKTAFTAEKTPGIRLELGTYYLKTCLNCGYTEMYSAKILDKDENLQPEY